jgi:hypothetical protein
MRFFERRALRNLTKSVGKESDLFDFHAEIDKSLSFSENKRIIRKKLGAKRESDPWDIDAYNAMGNAGLQQNYSGLRDYKARRHNPKKQYARSEIRDRRYSAQPFGRRISRTGRVYYEWRPNHGDANQMRRL